MTFWPVPALTVPALTAFKARTQDIERMLRDATSERWDGQVFDRVTLDEAFNNSSLKWYRNRFHQYNEGFDSAQPDTEFLMDWGYIVKERKELKPIRAAIILFGSPRAIHQLMPRPTLDVQFLPYGIRDEMPETRWIDRFVSEDNIIQTWQHLVAKYKFFMPKPFREIDPHTLARQDTPPGFRVFREAAVNLLIHQDYGDFSRKATIKFFQDGIQFWNPGDVFGDDSRLLEPGEKEVRNPSITAAMRRIVLCEQAGTGLRMMQREWQELGHSAPVLKNDRSWKAFEFFIPGLDNEYDSASTLMKAMFSNKETSVPPITEQVEAQEAQEAQGEAQDTLLALNPFETAILEACKEAPKTGQELLDIAGYSTRTGNFKRSLNRLLISKLICMTIPGKPRSSKQKYRLTETGHHLLNRLHEDGKS